MPGLPVMRVHHGLHLGGEAEERDKSGGILLDYVAAMDDLSTTYDIPFYNTYTELKIDSTNHPEYLVDGVHPNEATRYMMAQGLAQKLQETLENQE